MEIQLNRIMCATDFSDFGNQTVQNGIKLAKKLNAGLYICHVIDISLVNIYGEALFAPVKQEKQMIEHANKQIEDLMGGQEVEWTPLVVVGQPAFEIARLAEEHQADLLIAASHGRSGLSRLLLGSVAEKLMRLMHRPLLILRATEPSVGGPPLIVPFERILVGCDFSPDSELAIAYAVELSQIFNAELHVVHVMTTAIHKYSRLESAFDSREDFDRDIRRQYTEKMHRIVAETAPADFHAHTELLIGAPDGELREYARDEAFDLIVLGTRGTGIIETLFVGSTTDRVVRKARCPVLCVCHQI